MTNRLFWITRNTTAEFSKAHPQNQKRLYRRASTTFHLFHVNISTGKKRGNYLRIDLLLDSLKSRKKLSTAEQKFLYKVEASSISKCKLFDSSERESNFERAVFQRHRPGEYFLDRRRAKSSLFPKWKSVTIVFMYVA